jgi:hypothetical protein
MTIWRHHIYGLYQPKKLSLRTNNDVDLPFLLQKIHCYEVLNLFRKSWSPTFSRSEFILVTKRFKKCQFQFSRNWNSVSRKLHWRFSNNFRKRIVFESFGGWVRCSIFTVINVALVILLTKNVPHLFVGNWYWCTCIH